MKSAWVKNQTIGGGITHVYKYKSRFSKVRQSGRWKQEGGQGKSNRISLTLGLSYIAEFMESKTHKVSTEEVIFSSTGSSSTKGKKQTNKKNWFSLSFGTFHMFRQREFVLQGYSAWQSSLGSKGLAYCQGLSSILCTCSLHTIYIIILSTCSFQGGEIVQISNSDLVELYT